jgi:hypothetical protein
MQPPFQKWKADRLEYYRVFKQQVDSQADFWYKQIFFSNTSEEANSAFESLIKDINDATQKAEAKL